MVELKATRATNSPFAGKGSKKTVIIFIGNNYNFVNFHRTRRSAAKKTNCSGFLFGQGALINNASFEWVQSASNDSTHDS